MSIRGNVYVSSNLSVLGNTTIYGNLVVSGNHTALNVETLQVQDPVIQLNALSGQPAADNDIGFTGSYLNGGITYWTGLVKEGSSNFFYLFNTSDHVNPTNVTDFLNASSLENEDLAILK